MAITESINMSAPTNTNDSNHTESNTPTIFLYYNRIYKHRNIKISTEISTTNRSLLEPTSLTILSHTTKQENTIEKTITRQSINITDQNNYAITITVSINITTQLI